ncbi:MAG: rhamnulokinase family protein [Spirochaetota bacterium]
MEKFIAIDLGAESGRIIVGDVRQIEVILRFPNNPVRLLDSIFWDMPAIYTEIKKGLKEAFSKYQGEIAGIGIDTWGVDYALLDKNGDLIGNPYHYRDSRTDNMPEELFKIIPRKELYRETGIQVMQLNTIYQLYSFSKTHPELLNAAEHFLTTPDLFNYWLTGVIRNEYTIASTTQMLNPVTKSWSRRVLGAIGLNEKLFSPVIMPCTRIGPLLSSVAQELGADSNVEVIAVGCHDTASAVAAVPVTGTGDFAYLSSGTWSLLGIELDKPIINDKCAEENFTNEGSVNGGIRFLKNIMGLWIIQECKRAWDSEGKLYSYAELTTMADENGPAGFVIEPDDARFLKPGLIDDSMPDRIQNYCRETGQKAPGSIPATVRGVLESLARKYSQSIQKIEQLSGRKIKELYIIGGGSQNSLLCELTAKAACIPVHSGPIEAAALGNILMQSIATGQIRTIAEGRRLIRQSNAIKTYLP